MSAALDTGSELFSITFDRPLAAGPLAAANYFMRAGNVIWGALTAGASDNQVTGSAEPGGIDVGADIISYTPPPFDVTTPLGLPAAAFADFPLVVT